MEFSQPLTVPPTVPSFTSNHISHIFKNQPTNLERAKTTAVALVNRLYLTGRSHAEDLQLLHPLQVSSRGAGQNPMNTLRLGKKNALMIHQNVSDAEQTNYRGCVCVRDFFCIFYISALSWFFHQKINNKSLFQYTVMLRVQQNGYINNHGNRNWPFFFNSACCNKNIF